MRQLFLLYSIINLLAVGLIAFFWSHFLWLYLLLIPLITHGLYDLNQSHHSLWRNYPILTHRLWIMEALCSPIHQYFIESDTGGAPTNRMFCSIIYQLAKKQLDMSGWRGCVYFT